MKTFFSILPGERVRYCGEEWEINVVYDTSFVAARNCRTNEIQRLRIGEIQPLIEIKSESISAPAATIDDTLWQEAVQKFNYIRPLLDCGLNRTREDVSKVASQANVKVNTVYRWLRSFAVTGQISSLIRKNRSDRGSGRLSPEVEILVTESIHELYLSDQKRSIATVCEMIRARCKKAGLEIPHHNTVRNRISQISDNLKLTKRFGKKVAREVLSPIRNSFPGADYPLSVIQIDHTKMDIIVVDETHRRPLGRPWITLAFDVFSRMVCGFYISLDPPGTLGVALCLSHVILPKDRWLTQRKISNDWPVWGLPQCIHMDNAKEFRGNTLKRACDEYSIRIEWRPVATPHWGGHIERMMGTLATALHELPGTTFSNPQERGDYNSIDKASLTLYELERWVAEYITGIYHKRIHTQLTMPPEKQWELGILGDDTHPGTGLPERPADSRRILLDFLPVVNRSIQRYGVVIEQIHYYSDVLRPYIDTKDPENPKRARLFTFRYDPRDISTIYFLDPELNEYFEIPYRNMAHPTMSMWELREARKHALEFGVASLDEDAIFATRERLIDIEQSAKITTRKTRRSLERQIDKKYRPDNHLVLKKKEEVAIQTENNISNSKEQIEAFDDIDVEVD